MKTFKTPKGTELPLIDLKGKDYLQVAYRLVWFREDHPYGRIDTERLSESDKHVTYRAIISVTLPAYIAPTNNIKDNLNTSEYVKISNADKTLLIKSTLDYEKCETGAIGRALALAGYGTQFAPDDITEGDDLADAPIAPKPMPEKPKSTASHLMNRGGPPEGWPQDECNHKWTDSKYNDKEQYCSSCKLKRKKEVPLNR